MPQCLPRRNCHLNHDIIICLQPDDDALLDELDLDEVDGDREDSEAGKRREARKQTKEAEVTAWLVCACPSCFTSLH